MVANYWLEPAYCHLRVHRTTLSVVLIEKDIEQVRSLFIDILRSRTEEKVP